MCSLWAYWAPAHERSRLVGIGNAGSQIGNVSHFFFILSKLAEVILIIICRFFHSQLEDIFVLMVSMAVGLQFSMFLEQLVLYGL
mgnify:CR=1 FL=1